MNKTIEAILRGYILFTVNGKRFYRYNSALAERKSLSEAPYLNFSGLNIFYLFTKQPWRCFYERFNVVYNDGLYTDIVDPNDAMEVVEVLNQEGWMLDASYTGDWHVRFWRYVPDLYNDLYSATAATLPEAISKAALKVTQ
jgi:hypothetical protein